MARWLFNIVISIYNSVGKTYDLFQRMAVSGKNYDVQSLIDSFGSLIDAMYVLCGVFMLFRLTVSFLNMLIDPDKVNDKQAGAGSMIKRVIISVILLMVCTPSNFCFGILDRLQSAIVGPNGLLDNMLYSSEYVSLSTNNALNLLYDDVFADNSNDFYCLYTYSSINGQYETMMGGAASTYVAEIKSLGNVYIQITKDSNSDYKIKSMGLNSSNYYLNIVSGSSIVDSTNQTITYNNSLLTSSITKYQMNVSKIQNAYLNQGKCPPYIKISGKTATFQVNDPSSGTIGNAYCVNSPISKEDVLQTKVDSVNNAYGYYGNFTTISGDQINETFANDDSLSASEKAQATEDVKNSVLNISDSAHNFAVFIIKCFFEPLDGKDSTPEVLDNILDSQSANNEVYNLLKGNNATLDLDALLAIIVGLAVIVYLFILSIDLVVRNFKLILLKIIAPIPIISYIDPKDKIFNAWLKMFVSVYVDLFIKLFCINFGIRIIKLFSIQFEDEVGFYKIMFLVGIFVFIKAIPGLINKIFGIDTSSSSIKEIGNLVKKGGGIAVGGAIGGGLAIGSGVIAFAGSKGQGFGNRLVAGLSALKNVATGTITGMGGGYSGNFKAGITASKNNMRNFQAYSQGINASALAGGAILGGIGMDYATRKDREVQDLVDENARFDEFNNDYKGAMENLADSSKFMTTLAAARSKNLITGTQYENIRDKFIEEQIAHAGDKTYQGTSFKDMLKSEGISDPTALSKFDFNLDEQMVAEGKSTEMKELLTRANNDIRSNASVRKAIEADTDASQVSTIKNFSDLKKIDSAVKTKKRENTTKINAVKRDDKYREADAVRQMRNNNH